MGEEMWANTYICMSQDLVSTPNLVMTLLYLQNERTPSKASPLLHPSSGRGDELRGKVERIDQQGVKVKTACKETLGKPLT